jgi:hypothetical protein
MKRTIFILLMAVATAHAGWKIYDGNSWRASLPDILHLRVLTEKQLEGSMGAWHNTVFESEDKSVSLSVYTHPLDPENELQTLHAFFEAESQDERMRKTSSTILSSKTIGTWFQGPISKASNFTRNCGDTTTTGSLSISPILRQSRRCTNQCCWNFFETSPPACRGNGITE